MRTRERNVYITLSVIALLLFSLMSYIKGGAFDFDETFSLAMIEHSFAEMWMITARDYHPPLSYFILKALSWFIKPFAEGNLEIYRVTSILGYFGTILLCIFPIRRLLGFKVSVIAILLFMFMPISFYTYSNFRMYAWAAPFVLASFVYAYDVLITGGKWSWVKLTLFTSMAMYTHYYALISSFVIYILLLLVIFFAKKENLRKLLPSYLVSGFVLVALYAPWLYFFASQLAEVKSDYWIEKPALSDLIFAVQYYFVPKYYTEKYVNLLSSKWLLLIVPLLLTLSVSIISIAYLGFRNKCKEEKIQILASMAAFFVLFLSLVIVMAYTFAVSPVYHIRYLMCYLGLFVLGISICISLLMQKKQFCKHALIVVFSLCIVLDYGLCVHFNILRSNFSYRTELVKEKRAVDNYYCFEESFTDMAYLTVLHPQHNYYLVTDDNISTRKITAPYIEYDTISGMPFSNFQKVRKINTNESFLFLSKTDPRLDTLLNTNFKVVDSVYSGLYHMNPVRISLR